MANAAKSTQAYQPTLATTAVLTAAKSTQTYQSTLSTELVVAASTARIIAESSAPIQSW